MDLNATPPTAPQEAVVCSICLDPVAAADGVRSFALLQCGHKFHLDCIGSAFNARGTMQCPNCRNIEGGNWQNNANRLQPSGFDNRMHWEAYRHLLDIWRQVSMGNSWVTSREFPSFVQYPIDASTSPNTLLQNHGLEPISPGMGGDPSAGLSNVHGFGRTEPRNSEVQMIHFPAAEFITGPTTPFGFEVPTRYDGSNQQHLTQPTPRSWSSSAVPLGSSPAVTSRGYGGLRGHVVQQTIPPGTQSSPNPSTARRVRPRALYIASSIAASYPAEDREPHDNSRA